MPKEAYYFSHDCNARNDDKILAVRMRHGMEGYGIYFAILERLRESSDYMSTKDYNIVAFDLRVEPAKIKSIVEDFGLFQISEDGKNFFSPRFTERMRSVDEIREQRRKAGQESARKRSQGRQSDTSSTDVQQTLNKCSTDVQQGKEIKKKETKLKKNIPPSIPLGGEEENSSLLKLKKSLSWNSVDWEFIRRIEGIADDRSIVWQLVQSVYDNPRYATEDVVQALREGVKTGRMRLKDTTEQDLAAELSTLGIHQVGVEEIMDLAVGSYDVLRREIQNVIKSKGGIKNPHIYIKSRLR